MKELVLTGLLVLLLVGGAWLVYPPLAWFVGGYLVGAAVHYRGVR